MPSAGSAFVSTKEDRLGQSSRTRGGSWLLRTGCVLSLKGEDGRDHEAAAFSSSAHQGKEEKGIWTQALLMIKLT